MFEWIRWLESDIIMLIPPSIKENWHKVAVLSKMPPHPQQILHTTVKVSHCQDSWILEWNRLLNFDMIMWIRHFHQVDLVASRHGTQICVTCDSKNYCVCLFYCHTWGSTLPSCYIMIMLIRTWHATMRQCWCLTIYFHMMVGWGGLSSDLRRLVCRLMWVGYAWQF